jgi:hypothetical protein
MWFNDTFRSSAATKEHQSRLHRFLARATIKMESLAVELVTAHWDLSPIQGETRWGPKIIWRGYLYSFLLVK